MTIKTFRENGKGYTLEYPVCKEDCLFNRFSKALAKKVKSISLFEDTSLHSYLNYSHQTAEDTLHITYFIRLRKRGHTVETQEIKVTWKNGYIEDILFDGRQKNKRK